jgi:hypothetical protein
MRKRIENVLGLQWMAWPFYTLTDPDSLSRNGNVIRCTTRLSGRCCFLQSQEVTDIPIWAIIENQLLEDGGT